jgi:hypothetical protein
VTKVRTPDTFPDAVTKVIKYLGAGPAGKAVDRCERTLYEWADPASETLPTLLQALALDTAHRLAGGEDAPFCDVFIHQLGIKVERPDACNPALVTDSIEFIREAGELHAALFIAVQPGASPRDHHRALVEAQQVDGVLRRIRRRLPSFLRPVTVSGPEYGGACI